ncbi:carboxypeptidase N subunit 2 [Frankliniella occidentalis]|uniref:Carboxypeptidase N subunit 2 n=1 Tax=Frankliniella occidentalis TaxID=133901 RepID=A0A6J1RV99_FRAOC|nr:carboxypeptidase N subunit 2 [Frankliniella occidentalis]XP_026272279.1 carboxypeptidase N subunit 2 [Frankliniella occidentalis]
MMSRLLITIVLQGFLLQLQFGTSFSELSASLCGHAFRNRCTCGKTRISDAEPESFVVNCTNAGFTNTSALEHLPMDTQHLIFVGNNISVLPGNIFGDQDHTPNLKVVDMSNNAIKEIRGKAYHHVSSVEQLFLDHNELSLSPMKSGVENHRHPRMFSNFVNLRSLHLTNAFRDNSPSNLVNDLHDIFVNSNLSLLIKLHLEQNELTGFSDQMVFCDLPSLMDLHLGDNFLRGLHFNITCLHHLRFLDLQRNRITRLSKSDLAMLDTFPARGQSLTVDFSGNPFCDCQDLLAWLKTTKVIVRRKESLSCTHSSAAQSNSKDDAYQHVSCTTLHTSVTSTSIDNAAQGFHSGTALSLVLVSLAIIAFAILFIYRKRINFKPRGQGSLLDTVSRKVQYTTIEHHEEEVDV